MTAVQEVVKYPKRLIEVDLPIKAISAHARREKSIRHGHISTLHLWWARRPLAACRAVICASLWPDPGDDLCPPEFQERAAKALCSFAAKVRTMQHLGKLCPIGGKRWHRTEEPSLNGETRCAWELRHALLDFIADFANWDASTVPEFLETARAITQAAHETLGGLPGTRALVVDPFAGGGAIPLESLRVGADVVASDLNPVPVVINSLQLSRIPRTDESLIAKVDELAKRIHKEAQRRLAAFYPAELDGSLLVAYLWCRTIKCQGPGCVATVPLISSPVLAKRKTRTVGLSFAKNRDGTIRVVISDYPTITAVGAGTVRRGAVTCPACNFTTPVDAVRQQLSTRAGGANDALMYAKVVRTPAGDTEFRSAESRDLAAYASAQAALGRLSLTQEGLDLPLPPDGALGLRVQKYGITRWKDLFTPRQLLLLYTYASLVRELANDGVDEAERATLETIRMLLGMTVSKVASFSSTLCFWRNVRTCVAQTFGRTTQTLAMLWDFGEMNPFAESAGDFSEGIEYLKLLITQLQRTVPTSSVGEANSGDARHIALPDDSTDLVCTDPPYYDSVPYGHLSEFFLYWLNACNVVKISASEVKARRGSECIVDKALGLTRSHYEESMAAVMMECRRIAKPGALGVVVFAHKSVSAWEAQLQAMLDANWTVTASWPIDTERSGRPRARDSAVLASSIHIVCRTREQNTDAIGDWRDVLIELPKRIHDWMPRLASDGVVGADAIFACLGPALEVFSRYSRVEDSDGNEIRLKTYLERVWAAVAKEAISVIFTGADAAGFEPDARLTAMWLWTLFSASSATSSKNDAAAEDDDTAEAEDDEDTPKPKTKVAGFALEYDAARKIAQGLGADLEKLDSLVEIKGETARLLSVDERRKTLFGKVETPGAEPSAKTAKKKGQLKLGFKADPNADEEPTSDTTFGVGAGPVQPGASVLDRVHQAMILFGANQSAALKRFLVEGQVGKDSRFWSLADHLSKLYPAASSEKRLVDGVLARKKGLGF